MMLCLGDYLGALEDSNLRCVDASAGQMFTKFGKSPCHMVKFQNVCPIRHAVDGE